MFKISQTSNRFCKNKVAIMNILDILYDNPPKNRRFLPRKYEITNPKTLLFGPRGSGKSSIIIDYLNSFLSKQVLYIDFSDIRVEHEKVENVQEFIHKNGIKLVVLEHFNFQCQIPNAEHIVLSSSAHIDIEGFDELFVPFLDFEEFMSFNKKHQNIEHIFNLFANIGTNPNIVLGQEEAKHRLLQQILKSFLRQNELDILSAMATFQSNSISVLRIYELLKTKIPLSKDMIYKQIKTLENEFYIYFVPKFDKERANKKFYFADFALKNALVFSKNFLTRFENIVFCELIKKEREIFYLDLFDFYIPSKNKAVLCVPFLPPELIKRRFIKLVEELKKFNIAKLQIVTIGNEGRYAQEGITCEILPFWEWAMGS